MEKKIILLDTNIIIETYRGNDEICRIINDSMDCDWAISSITACELFFGARNKDELKFIKKDVEKFRVIHVDQAISMMSLQLIEKHSLSQKLSIPDSLIAATAIHHKLELFTLNIKDFKFLENLLIFKNTK